jgi:hypothetical protein
MLSVQRYIVMLAVSMLSVIMLNVVAPLKGPDDIPWYRRVKEKNEMIKHSLPFVQGSMLLNFFLR